MSKFNTARAPAATSPVRGEATPSAVTHQGAPGYARDARSELFLLAVTNMVGEHTFYESADARDTRFTALVHAATLKDPQWTARFLGWLRSEANLRTASLVGAAEFAKARRDAGLDGLGRQVVADVLQRADEPGELLAYWTSVHGRNVPKPVKRGIADAARKLYDERAYVKWDSAARAFRFADVLELTHPAARDTAQGELFKHILDERHDRGNPLPETLGVLRARAELTSWEVPRRRALLQRPDAADVLRAAGMTWESVAGWLQGPLDARVWEALIPSMGYMAQLRNLRNFDEAGVSDEVAQRVAARLADPGQVAKSRQLPMRFLSAYRAAPSLRWAWALEQAIAHSLANVPRLPGRTLVLVDTSSSMNMGFSRDGTLMRWDAAAVFGLALGRRCADADVVSFSDRLLGGTRTKVFKLRPGGSLLSDVERWKSGGFFLGGGTNTAGAVKKHFAKHDRVVILTDEQAVYGDVGHALPAQVPLYTWNLAGYRFGHAPSGSANRHTFGGLTDQAFRMIPLLEAGRNADWPF
ncbi:TROVE domain-containing protein [Amycolatopsis australiensis]|uniref:TROVE domain-containing protein n=1 Tax=Amycolatopsis australiensis TaxID=546364 RepID=A0A1K1P8D8_9PSEU|nr:TROVE domain-containing protein [Amycolatopsis australiensis]SFW43717.1 TROVE domain-containing protein [Amycolatopsis australiensis]